MIVVGLGFGDEGKGTIVDWLTRENKASAVVRFNGGPQAGHNVVTDDGRWHCFAQLAAGSFAGARTILGPHMLVELEALAAELDVFGGADVTIDPACTVITPMHKLVGQLTELHERRSSCGMGVGEAVRWRERGVFVCAGDLSALQTLRDEAFALAAPLVDSDEARALHVYFVERCQPEVLFDRYRQVLARVRVAATAPPRDAIYEGAQGALLDRTRGFRPYVTQAVTTHDHATALAPGSRKLGVLRAYMTRHGRGPLVTEGTLIPDRYNPANRWQGEFRTGALDLVALRYAVAINGGVDELAVTSLDRISEWRVCTAYDGMGVIDRPDTEAILRCRPSEWRTFTSEEHFLAAIEEALGAPVTIVSRGPDAKSKKRRRAR